MARHYRIPTTSLCDHVIGKTISRKHGKSGVLSLEEENELVKWILKMQTLGHPINLSQCRLKVAKITQDRDTPSTKGIPSPWWVKWFKIRNPTLTLRVAQGLEQCRAKGLCLVNVASLYDNLLDTYTRHKYPATHIWNCDESGAQAVRNGGGHVLAKRGIRSVHTITPDEREWLFVWSCINASGSSILNFYIFKGRSSRQNFIIKCEEGACMAMQKNVDDGNIVQRVD